MLTSLRQPESVYGRIASRSGLAFNKCIDVARGVIDPDYTGEIKVILVNHGETDYNIQVGHRIAQIVFEKYADVAVSPFRVKVRKDSISVYHGIQGSNSFVSSHNKRKL